MSGSMAGDLPSRDELVALIRTLREDNARLVAERDAAREHRADAEARMETAEAALATERAARIAAEADRDAIKGNGDDAYAKWEAERDARIAAERRLAELREQMELRNRRIAELEARDGIILITTKETQP